jgi:hypothetical protein
MRSVAALGMGDAYYAKSDSKYAPFYNPAGLARVKNSRVDIIRISFGVGTNFLDFYNDYNNTDTGSNSDIADLISGQIGKLQHADISLYPGYTRKNFTMGVFAVAQVNAAPWNPVTPELNVDINTDGGVVSGIASEYFDDRLQVGFSGRYQQRSGLQRAYTVNDVVSGELEDIDIVGMMKNGWDVLFDLGVIYNILPENPLQPRVAVAVNNLCINGMGEAKSVPWAINLSAGISPGYKFITTDIILDVRDVTQNFKEGSDWGKRVNLGAEMWFFDRVALRGGLHQGWMAYGLGVDFWIVRADYAYYQEEIGSYAGQKKDERHAFELILGF